MNKKTDCSNLYLNFLVEICNTFTDIKKHFYTIIFIFDFETILTIS